MHSIRLGKNIVDLFLISDKKYTYSLDLNLNTDTTHIIQFPRKNSTQLGNIYPRSDFQSFSDTEKDINNI